MSRLSATEHSAQSSQLSPMSLSLVGLEQAGFLPSTCRDNRPGRGSGRRNGTSDRRVTSYYNQFSSRCAVSNDAPPSYQNAARESRFAPPRQWNCGREPLPNYTCTVFKEGPMQFRLESCSPFLILPFQEWRSVYVVLQGTALNIYKLKTAIVDKIQISSPGRLLRKYTLQHAEIGLATDITYNLLVPTTRLAGLIPPIARKKAHEKDPHLFRLDKHYGLRMRSELDQFVLTYAGEEQIISWVNHISAGIDIAPAIDERTLPRQCTMPRRRRRQQREINANDLENPTFIEQQRRLLEAFPSMSDSAAPPLERVRSNLDPVREEDASREGSIAHSTDAPSMEQDQEDIDLSAIAEEAPSPRPTSTSSTAQGPLASETALQRRFTAADLEALNFDADGKWAPLHPRTAAQQFRYIRRCQPILLGDTPRHSSVMIADGRYVRPNYKSDTLEDWSLQPPNYEAHNFAESQRTAAGPGVHRPSFSSGSTAQSGTRTTLPPVSQAVDPKMGPHVVDIQALTSSALNLDFKNFSISEHELKTRREESRPGRPITATKREPSQLSTITAREDSPTRILFGF